MKLIMVNDKLNKLRFIGIVFLGISLLFLMSHAISLVVLNGSLLIILLSTLVISLASISFFQGQNQIGYIHLSLNHVEIFKEEKNQKYSIRELKYLRFKIHSYNDQKGLITLFTLKGASGLGNYLYFGKPDRRYQFYLEDQYQKETLIELIEALRKLRHKPMIEYKIDKIY